MEADRAIQAWQRTGLRAWGLQNLRDYHWSLLIDRAMETGGLHGTASAALAQDRVFCFPEQFLGSCHVILSRAKKRKLIKQAGALRPFPQ